jgi:D-alanyl-lipoteichoic acid acyltransferase DltB (MBOAT superfamily)
VSVITNLGFLGVFKYFDFFSQSLVDLAAMFDAELSWTTLNIILPVGISFYTFQTMSYTIEVYRDKLTPTRRFLDFALFVSFFPQLVAGPIERATRLLPQVLNPRVVTWYGIRRGATLVLIGLVKKVAIADGVARSVDAAYAGISPTWIDLLIGTYCFAIQIYCDFSGYTDIARGIAKMLGFELMLNFNLPYVATNPSDFWRRWHISLSTWLRDYLYIPLGGSLGSSVMTYRNLMLTMLLGGLWHGAAWNFVLWGLFHGTILCVARPFTMLASSEGPVPSAWRMRCAHLIKIVCFFQVTCIGWLLFRAHSFEQILSFAQILVTSVGDLTRSIPRPTVAALAALPLTLLYEFGWFVTDSPRYYERLPAIVRGGFYASLIFVLLMGLTNAPAQFIYFQF